MPVHLLSAVNPLAQCPYIKASASDYSKPDRRRLRDWPVPFGKNYQIGIELHRTWQTPYRTKRTPTTDEPASTDNNGQTDGHIAAVNDNGKRLGLVRLDTKQI